MAGNLDAPGELRAAGLTRSLPGVHVSPALSKTAVRHRADPADASASVGVASRGAAASVGTGGRKGCLDGSMALAYSIVFATSADEGRGVRPVSHTVPKGKTAGAIRDAGIGTPAEFSVGPIRTRQVATGGESGRMKASGPLAESVEPVRYVQ